MLIGIALHVYITLGSMDILVISIFQFICMEYLSIIYVFFNFSHRCYSQFMVYRSFTSLIGFIHMYFIHFDAVVNCIVFFLRYVRLTMFLLVSCVQQSDSVVYILIYISDSFILQVIEHSSLCYTVNPCYIYSIHIYVSGVCQYCFIYLSNSLLLVYYLLIFVY